MKKYIFRREKILSDGDVGIMSEGMKWPVNCDGCEAFFPDGKWKGYVDNPLGYRATVYPEWCEVVDENEDAPTTAPNNDKEAK